MRRKKFTLTVLIPAVNEEKTIQKIVTDSLKLKGYKKIQALVVLDNKTTDNTAKIAKKAGAKVINAGIALGKGAAVRFAIPFIKTDFVVQIDADYQFLPKEIPLLIEPLVEGYDVTLGTRYQKGAHVQKGSVSFLKLFGSLFLSLITSIVVVQRITDVMAGFKAFKTEKLKKIIPQTNHFGYEAELVIKSAQKNYKILNIPISYKKRSIGNSNVSSIKHGILVLMTIFITGLELN